MIKYFSALLIVILLGFSVQAQQTNKPKVSSHIFQGVIKSVVFDNEQGSQKQFLDTGTRLIPVSLEANEFLGAKVSIAGKLDDQGVILPDKIAVLDRESETAVDLPVSGERTVAVLLLNFSNDTSQPVSVEQARRRVFTDPTSANAYYQQVSDGRLSLTSIQRSDGDVFGYLTLPFTNANCTLDRVLNEWKPAARNLALQNGINLNSYHHVIYVFPQDMPSCPSGGVADLGQIGDNQTRELNVTLLGPYVFNENNNRIPHELGHNLGLQHSSSYYGNCSPAEPFENCQPVNEYGDYDVMGRSNYLLNNYHQSRFGWLNGQTLTFDSPGIYYVNLYSPNHPAKRATMARIRLKYPNGNFTGNSIFLEFRRRLPPFDNSSDSNLFAHSGVSIRYGFESPGFLYSRSILIDTTPSTTIPGDEMLLPGNTFTNSYYGVNIIALSVNPFFGARVKIELTR
jgi:Gametolysin peptidase M11